jgi:hypothetical protein
MKRSGPALLCAAMLVLTASSAPAAQTQAIPDFSSAGAAWLRIDNIYLPPPGGGPGPVLDDPAHVHHGRGVGRDGRDTGTTPEVGDYTNPILKPAAAAIVKKNGEQELAGHTILNASTTCWPPGVPNVLTLNEPLYVYQTPKEVVLVSQRDHQVRHVYLNRPHSAHPGHGWLGESVGHYENGDTLVVDTVGFNDRTVIDRFGTPHSDALHVVERYQRLDGGKKLRIVFTVEDPKTFTTTWSAMMEFRQVASRLTETICAENNTDFFTGKLYPIPTAAKPDF